MTDDLTRRAVIAAHDAECSPQCSDEATHYPKLTKREQAIVELWRADVDTIERIRTIAFDPDTISAVECGAVRDDSYFDSLTAQESIGYAKDALRDIRAALDGSGTP